MELTQVEGLTEVEGWTQRLQGAVEELVAVELTQVEGWIQWLQGVQ